MATPSNTPDNATALCGPLTNKGRTRVLFVCLGNICRSPAAEAVFRARVAAAGLSHGFEADSAGLADYHEGEPADERMRRQAAARGYALTHRSRPVTREDFSRFDVIVAMDEANVRGLRRVAPSAGAMEKVVRMADYLQRHQSDCIPDPYYGSAQAFESVLDLLEDACGGLLAALRQGKAE